jgi:hypothetical protein
MTTLKVYARMKKLAALRKDGSAHGRARWSGLPSLACALVAFLCVTMISSCGGGNGSITLAVTPKTATMDQGQPLLFVATLGDDTKNLGVTWQPLTGSGCAGTSCGTLTNVTPTSVTYTAPAGLTTGITVSLEAIAKANSSVTTTSTITIVLPVTFTTTSLPNGSNGVAYNQTIVTTGGVSPITYALGTGSLPAGLKLNNVGTVIGTPSSSGTSTFTINAIDDGTPPLTVPSPIYTITINPPPPLSITSTAMANGIVGTAYSSAIASSGGVPQLTWSVPPGTLPPGLELNTSSGLISGTPTTAGVYTFFPTVTDSAIPRQKFTAKTGVTISVLTVSQPQSVTPPLPPGDVAVGYTASLVATGGVAPYTWSITNGQLPSGLTLNSKQGTISGIPILTTTANFAVEVEDANSTKSAPQNLSIVINKPGSAITNSLFSGAYSFLFHGFDSGGNVEMAGNFTANGNGTIIAGQLDSNRSGGTLGIFTGSTFSGTYTVGSDGRGTMQWITTNSKGATSTTNYLLAEDSGGNFHMIENDTTGTPQTHGSGVMKPVVGGALSGSFFSGNYVFELDGQDNQGKSEVIVGVTHADGVSQLTPGMFDVNDGGTYSSAVPVTGSFQVGASNVKGLLFLTYQIPNSAQVIAAYTFYFVSPSDIFLMAVDPTDATHPRLGGELILQQASTVFDATALNGVSVATGSGLDGSNAIVLAGLLSGNGISGVGVSYDQNEGGTVSSGNTATGTYIADPSTNGRMAFTGLGSRIAAAYLTAPNQGILIGSDSAVTYGLLQAQTSPPFSSTSIMGGYTLSAETTLDPAAVNITGQLDSLTGNGTMTGILDEADNDGTPHTDQSVVIPNYVVAPTGRGTMQIGSTIGLPSGMVIYVVSPSSFSGISTDANPGNEHPVVMYFNH